MNKILRWFLIIGGTLIVFAIALVLYFGVLSVAIEKDGSSTGKRAFLWTVGEGEGFETNSFSGPSFIVNNACKPGLRAVSAAKDIGGKFGCVYPMCGCYVCIKCGDGICGIGENSCNCKEDCKPGEGEKNSLEDVYHPVAYKSDDFNGAFEYDPNYDPEKDELLQFMDLLQNKIYNSDTHNGKEGGSFALSMGKEDMDWQTDSKQPKQVLNGRFFGIKGPDNAERARAKNYFNENGFVPNKMNSTTEISAYVKGKFVCFYQENLPFDDFRFKCAMIE